jgi:hypothetical protein
MEKMAGKVVRTDSDWSALIKACERSGRSVASFCKENGISYSHSLYHRRRILKIRSPVRSIAMANNYTPVSQSGGFVPVRIEESCGMRLRR